VKDQLIGSWKVLSYKAQIVGQDNWREPIGSNPKGYVIFTAEGRFIQFITASGRKPPTNDAERVALLNSVNSKRILSFAIGSDQLYFRLDLLRSVDIYVRSPFTLPPSMHA
jgi:hypothetical protein